MNGEDVYCSNFIFETDEGIDRGYYKGFSEFYGPKSMIAISPKKYKTSKAGLIYGMIKLSYFCNIM